MNMEDKIEEYLLGRMSDNEKKTFEDEVSKSPELKRELNFQKQLISSIKDVRRQQLKQSLSAVPVSYSNTRRYVTYLAAAAGLLIGGLLIYNFTESNKTESLPKTEVLENTIKTEPIAETQNSSDKTELVFEENTVNEVVENVVKNTTNSEAIVKDKKPTKSKSGEIDYSKMNLEPSLATKESGEVKSTNSLDNSPKGLTNGITAEKVKEIIPKFERTSKSFKKYKYDGENLTLVGDYKSDTPYIIYELKVNNSNSLYLRFENKYYEIKNTGSYVVNLELLENKEIISNLDKK